jgi:hypothetical protein
VTGLTGASVDSGNGADAESTPRRPAFAQVARAGGGFSGNLSAPSRTEAFRPSSPPVRSARVFVYARPATEAQPRGFCGGCRQKRWRNSGTRKPGVEHARNGLTFAGFQSESRFSIHASGLAPAAGPRRLLFFRRGFFHNSTCSTKRERIGRRRIDIPVVSLLQPLLPIQGCGSDSRRIGASGNFFLNGV